MQTNCSVRAVLRMHSQLFWTTQISGVITLALAKLSLVVLFQRIAPKQMGPQTTTWLMPMVAVYTLLSLFLIAFQCQMPQPWILSPRSCSTHGNVYYPITISNMLTDAMLAIWIFPVIWGLQMKVHTKSVVLWLFGSRLLICVADIGRMVVIHKALQSEDQTRKIPRSLSNITKFFHTVLIFGSHVTNNISGSQLIWAVMDQVVVHLSINHATLPRIQTFLSHLQIGGMSTHMGASRSGPRTTSKERSSAAKTSENHLNGNKVGRASDKAWDSLRNRLTGSLNRTPSISEQPLTHQQQGIELSTIVYSGKSEAEQRNVEQDRSAATSSEGLTREQSTDRLEGVRVQKDFQIVYNQM